MLGRRGRIGAADGRFNGSITRQFIAYTSAHHYLRGENKQQKREMRKTDGRRIIHAGKGTGAEEGRVRRAPERVCLLVGWLFNVPATC